MPFASQAQRAFMYAEHPDLAKRWEAVTPKGQALPAHVSQHGSANTKQHFSPSKPSESNETDKPGVPKLPRKNEQKRDFGPLHPSSKARLKTSHQADTKESDEEWGVEAHTGSKGPNKLHLRGKNLIDPLGKRDIKQAARKKV